VPIREVIAVLQRRLRRGLSHYRFRLLAGGLVRALIIGAAALLTSLFLGVLLAKVPGAFLPLAVGTAVTLAACAVRYVVAVCPICAVSCASRGSTPGALSLVNALGWRPSPTAPARARRHRASPRPRPRKPRSSSRDSDFQALAPEALPRGWGRPLIGGGPAVDRVLRRVRSRARVGLL
jgi:hypothetical protein